MKFENMREELEHILDEHLNCINVINRSILFPNEMDKALCSYQNKPLTNFFETLKKEDDFFSIGALERVLEIKLALEKISETFCQKIESGKLEKGIYNEFQMLSNEFTTRLLRFETDFTKEGNGIDPLTGLRNSSIILDDLKRGLSACARRGDYLGIAVGYIDNFDDIIQKITQEERNEILLFVADVLKQAMRLYDDGYRYKKDLFITCFKHTDHLGAVSAAERFVIMLREAHNSDIGDKIHKLIGHDITLSYSVAKLEVGTNINEFLDRIEKDVRENADQPSTILEYEDVSSLQKFLEDTDKI